MAVRDYLKQLKQLDAPIASPSPQVKPPVSPTQMASPTPQPAPMSVPTKLQSNPMTDQEYRSSMYGSTPQEQLIKGGSIKNLSVLPEKIYQAPLKAMEAPLGVASQVIPGGNQAVGMFQNLWNKAGNTGLGQLMSKVVPWLFEAPINYAKQAIETPQLIKYGVKSMGKSVILK